MSMQAQRSGVEFIPAAELRVVVEACSTPLVGEPISETAAAGLAQVFKALGDPVRLRLVSLIGAHQGGQVCVCDLTTAFDLTQPTISHHLKVLREAGIIDSERRGTWVYYWLVPAALERMSALLSAPNANSPSGGHAR
jgi:ArsR family transcriptional regulator